MMSIFLKDESGNRPVFGDREKFQNDPYWRNYPSYVTFRKRGVAKTESIHQANKKKIGSLQQSNDENQVVKNGSERCRAQGIIAQNKIAG